MTTLERRALARVALTIETVQSFYDGTRGGTAEQCLKALCESHERLRAEMIGSEVLREDARTGRWFMSLYEVFERNGDGETVAYYGCARDAHAAWTLMYLAHAGLLTPISFSDQWLTLRLASTANTCPSFGAESLPPLGVIGDCYFTEIINGRTQRRQDQQQAFLGTGLRPGRGE